MAKPSKRSRAAREKVDPNVRVSVDEAIRLVKEHAVSKFDETVELSINLNVDPRHADQNIRGVVSLPNGTGKPVRVAVFAKDAKAEEAKAAGADIVGAIRRVRMAVKVAEGFLSAGTVSSDGGDGFRT